MARDVNFILALLFLTAAFLPVPAVNGWAYRQIYGLVLLSLFAGFAIGKRFHWSVGLFFVATMLNAFFHGVSPNLSQLLIITVGTCLLDDVKFETVLPLLGLVALGDALIVFVKYLITHDSNQAWYVLTAASLEASFIAVMLPVFFEFTPKSRTKIGLFFFLLTVFFITKSNTALFTLFAMAVSYLIARKETGAKLYAAVFGGLAVGAGWLVFIGHKFLDDNDRFKNWALMMDYWWHNVNIWVGSGPGTYYQFAIAVQPTKEKFLWLHNDWLQQLFTQGILGLVCLGLLYFFMLKRSFKTPYLFSMVVGFGVVALTLMPVHLFFFQVLGVTLIWNCFKDEGAQHA